MKRIFVRTLSGSDWRLRLAKPDLHWKKGASAMTTAAAWEAARDRLPLEISQLLEATKLPVLRGQRLLIALPEWEVELPGGKNPSCTDVMAICRNENDLCVVGVEAKVLETFGPTVGEKRAEASDGLQQRLDYLHRLLGVDRFGDSVRYQLLHRTASVVLTAREFNAAAGVMLIQSWSASEAQKTDFKNFVQAMRASSVSPGVFLAPTVAGAPLYLAWCDGDEAFRSVELPA